MSNRKETLPEDAHLAPASLLHIFPRPLTRYFFCDFDLAQEVTIKYGQVQRFVGKPFPNYQRLLPKAVEAQQPYDPFLCDVFQLGHVFLSEMMVRSAK